MGHRIQYISTCDECGKDLPDGGNGYEHVRIKRTYETESRHNGDPYETEMVLKICLPCIRKTYPKVLQEY